MDVLLHDERRILVTELFGHDLDGYARLDGDRCMGVPKIVKPDPWQGCISLSVSEHWRERIRTKPVPIRWRRGLAGYGSGGWGFESLRACHRNPCSARVSLVGDFSNCQWSLRTAWSGVRRCLFTWSYSHFKGMDSHTRWTTIRAHVTGVRRLNDAVGRAVALQGGCLGSGRMNAAHQSARLYTRAAVPPRTAACVSAEYADKHDR